MTLYGRLFLILYALIGIPLTLVTMDDLGRFLCDAIYKLLKEVPFQITEIDRFRT